MATAIEEFFAVLGFKVDDKELQGFQKHLDTARNAALAFGAVAVAAGTSLAVFTTKIADQLDQLGDYAEMEQVSAVALQELGHAAQLNGSNLDAVKSTMSGLNRVMGEAILGVGRGAKIFEHLGFEAKNADGKVKTLDQLLGEVADRMQGLSRQEQIAMAEKLGIDRSLIPLLIKGKDAIEAYRLEARELGIATAEDIVQAGLFSDSFDRIKKALEGLSIKIAARIMPAMRNLMDRFLAWFKLNKDWINLKIEQVISALGIVLGVLGDILFSVVDVLTDVVSWLFQFKIVTYLAIAALASLIGLGIVAMLTTMVGWIIAGTKALMAFNFQALLIPALIGLIVAAIALVIEDIYQWKKGNDSVIGDILGKYPQVANMIGTIASAVMSIGTAYDYVVDKISRFIEFVAKSVDAVNKLASIGFGGGASMRLPGATSPMTQGGKPRLLQSDGALGAGINNTSSISNQQSNVFNIKSTDPKGAASEVGKAIAKQNRSVSRNNRSAVVQ